VAARRTRKTRSPESSSRPSLFFIIALILGLALIAWGFMVSIPKPAGDGEERSGRVDPMPVPPALHGFRSFTQHVALGAQYLPHHPGVNMNP
jgi:hypothetical protein